MMKLKVKNPREQTIDSMSPEAQKAVDFIKNEFKSDFKEFPETFSTWYILRFLRSRNFDLSKTKKMMRNFFDYRRKKNMDKIR